MFLRFMIPSNRVVRQARDARAVHDTKDYTCTCDTCESVEEVQTFKVKWRELSIAAEHVVYCVVERLHNDKEDPGFEHGDIFLQLTNQSGWTIPLTAEHLDQLEKAGIYERPLPNIF